MTTGDPSGGNHIAASMAAPGAGDGRHARNAGWNAISFLGPLLSASLAAIYVARILGPTRYGRYVYLVFVYTAGNATAVRGMGVAASRWVSMARGRGTDGEGDAIAGYAFLNVIVGAAIVGATIGVFGATRPEPAGFVFAGVAVAGIGPSQVLQAVLQARERFRALAALSTIHAVLNPALTIVAVARHADVPVLVGIGALTALVYAVCAFYAARPITLRGPVPSRRELVRYNRHYIVIAVIGVIVWQRCEIVFLTRYRASAEVAYYGIGFGLAKAVGLMGLSVVSIGGLGLTRVAAGENVEVLRRAFHRSVRMASIVAVPLSFGAAGLLPTVVRRVYGTAYSPSVRPAIVTMLAVSLLPLQNIGASFIGSLGDLMPLIRIEVPWMLEGKANGSQNLLIRHKRNTQHR